MGLICAHSCSSLLGKKLLYLPICSMESQSSNVDLALTKNKRAETAKISKMQKSLFKRADQLSILCGIQIAIIIFSVDRQPILFGKPDVESVVHQFREASDLTAPRFYMKMKKKDGENKEREKSIEDDNTQRLSGDFESPYLESLLNLHRQLKDFEDQLIKETDLTQLNQEIKKHKDSKSVSKMNVASSSTLPTNMASP